MTTGSVLAQFAITLSQAVSEQVAVEWHTADGTALAGVDYATAKGTVLFAPGQTTKTVDILVHGRAVGSEDRSFFVEMLPPTNAILGASAGECVIHVDTTGSTPITQIIVPAGPRGIEGKSAYRVWLDLGNTGTEQDFIDSLSPPIDDIAAEVAPLIDVGNTTLTAQGTESLGHPDATTVKAVARRVAYVGATKIATVVLADGDNLIGHSDLAGDAVEFGSFSLFPRIARGTTIISPEWSVQTDGRLLIKSAVAGDQLYVCQYDGLSKYAVNRLSREAMRRSCAEAGYNLVPGSFEQAGVVTTANDVLLLESVGKAYAWGGALPKPVSQGSNPVGTGGISPTAWIDVSNLLLRSEFGVIEPVFNTPSDIPASLKVGVRVRTLGRYSAGKGGGEYVITAGTSPYPLVDPQISPDKYAKLQPLPSTNYNYSLLAAGGKNDLTIDSSTSTALNQLLAKIWAESPVFGGLVRAEGGRYYLTASVVRPAVGAKGLGIVGEYSTMTYGVFESRAQFFFDNAMTGGYAFDFYETQYTTLSDFALRGDVGVAPSRSGIRLGKDGSPSASGYANHILERLNVTYCYDCILLKNSGISTLRDIQVSNFFGRGVTLETSGDSNLYNVYANDGNKDTTETSLGVGVGIYVGLGSNNVNIFGGKLEYNSKGLVCHGSNGLSAMGIQFDYNKMANHIVKSIDDGAQACRGNTSVGCRYLSGGVLAGYQKAGIYIDGTAGSVTLSISGGGLQSAGDGAFDSSTSGVIGPEVGVYAKGNSTYTLNVDGAGLILDSPGAVYAAVADGAGVKVKLSGAGGKKTTQELNGGKCHIGFYIERTDTIAFSAASGSAEYLANSCDTTVIDGIATMDLMIQLNTISSMSGDVTIGLLPYENAGSNAASVLFGMISSVSNVNYGMLGYVSPGENKITLWKRNSDGSVSKLQGSDLLASSLMRVSVKMKVA